AKDVVANARQVFHAAAADEDDGVFLQVVAFARNVADRLVLRRETDLGDFPESRVRLLRRRRVDAGADAAALRARLGGPNLVPLRFVMPRLADELLNRRHQSSRLSSRAKNTCRDKAHACPGQTL